MSPMAELEHYVAYAAMLIFICWFFGVFLGIEPGVPG